MKSGLQTPASVGRPESGGQILYFLYVYIFFMFYILFILFKLLHNHIELSAQSDVKTNRFATLGDHASFP